MFDILAGQMKQGRAVNNFIIIIIPDTDSDGGVKHNTIERSHCDSAAEDRERAGATIKFHVSILFANRYPLTDTCLAPEYPGNLRAIASR